MAKMAIEKWQKIRQIESHINNNLFIICTVVTFLAMAMVAVEFFSRGIFPPSGLNLFYIGVLLVYSVHKELIRWMGDGNKDRRGEWFLYSWISLTVVLYAINFICKGYFNNSPTGASVEALRESSIITLEVSSVFILTRLSKTVKIVLNHGDILDHEK